MSKQLFLATFFAGLAWFGTGGAKPVAPQAFCAHYPDAPVCTNGFASCETCHTTPPSPECIRRKSRHSFIAHRTITACLTKCLWGRLANQLGGRISEFDADLDGYSNEEELLAGADPSNAESTPTEERCEDDIRINAEHPANGWNVCGYDLLYAYKKVLLDFCGRSPTYDELADFRTLNDGQSERIDETDACSMSNFWRGKDGVVWHLVNDKDSTSVPDYER